jgi:hypothetical protein
MGIDWEENREEQGKLYNILLHSLEAFKKTAEERGANVWVYWDEIKPLCIACGIKGNIKFTLDRKR